MDAEKFVSFLDGQISKGLLGQDYTTQPGKTGARSASEVAERGTLKLSTYDAKAVCDTLERDLVRWIVRLNWPGCEERLCPRLGLNVNEDLSARELADLALKLAGVGVPWSKKDVAERAGAKLVDKDDEDDEPIKLTAAAPATPPASPDGTEPPDGGSGSDDDEDEEPEASATGDRVDRPDRPARGEDDTQQAAE